TQTGDENEASIIQGESTKLATDNEATQSHKGDLNKAYVVQASIYGTGTNNSLVSQTQIGDSNFIKSEQQGNDHSSTTVQFGNDNIANDLQKGSGQTSIVGQVGSANTSDVVQNGWGHTSAVVQ